jgi:hypothetical protein
VVRIYEANDVFSLNYWPLQVGAILGSMFRNVIVLLSACSQDSFQVTEDQQGPASGSASATVDQQLQLQQQAEHGLTCLAWSDCPFELPRLVVGGYSKVAVVWMCEGNKWKQVCSL